MTKYLISHGIEHEDLELISSDSWMAVEVPDSVVAQYLRAKAGWEQAQELLGKLYDIKLRMQEERLCPGKVKHPYADDPRYAHWNNHLTPGPCMSYVDDNGICPREAVHVEETE